MAGSDESHTTAQPGAAGQNTPPRGSASIRVRLLALALGLTVLAIIAITVAAFDSASTVIRRAQQTSSESLRSQAEAYLVQINESIASQNNLVLDRAARDVQAVAETTAAIFDGDLPADYWSSDERLVEGPEGQYLNGETDVSSVLVPNTRKLDYQVRRDVELSGYLDLMLPAIMNNNPNAAAIYLGTSQDVTRYYPNIMLGEVVPADFLVSQRPWYITSLKENRGKPTASPVWSPVYQDATGLGLVTTIAMPVYEESGRLVGVVGLDLTLDEISKSIQATRFFKSGYSFLVDRDGNAIILPDQGYRDILGLEPEQAQAGQGAEAAPDLKSASEAAFAPVIERMMNGERGFMSLQPMGRELFVAFSPLESSGWSLGSVVAADDVLQSVAALEQDLNQTTRAALLQRVAPIGIGISLFLILIAIFLTNRLVNPIQKLAAAAERIGAGERQVQVPVQQNDEIGFLGRTLENMAAQIHEAIDKLEQRVTERTQQLEKRTLQLQTAAEVASDITTARDLEQLLKRAVDLISARFGFSNVGIFLIDETREYAQLKAASGDLGRKLLEQRIKLRVGQQDIVGYVTQFGQVRLVGDVRADEMYASEPLLAETRSEVTIPLLARGETRGELAGDVSPAAGPRAIIGALDVQSREVEAFTQDDVTVLQVLADQLAIAIQNIRLVDQLQNTLRDLSMFSQLQTQSAWSKFSDQTGGLAYQYDRLDVRPSALVAIDQAELASGPEPARGERLVAPIRLRDQVIGVIGLESDDPAHTWTEDEIAILQSTAVQAALTIENARLLAESQRKARQEEMAAEITARMRASLDMETVLRTTLNEIAQNLGAARIDLQFSSDLAKQAGSRIPSKPAPGSNGDGANPLRGEMP